MAKGKMSNIDKIRQEIKRRRDITAEIFEENSDTYYQGKAVAYNGLLSFIDSLPEEKPSEDLEEEIEQIVEKYNSLANGSRVMKPSGIEKIARHFYELGKQSKWPVSEDLKEAAGLYLDNHKPLTRYNWGDLQDAFIAGAEWQKEQMMKDAAEGEIGYWNQRGLSIRLDQSLERLGYDEDTKVKIIIVKNATRRK